MATFAQHFCLEKTQAELDFVDVVLETDNRLFVDPFAISQRLDRWGQDAHLALKAFFQAIVDRLRAGRHVEARALLQNLAEPNETRFGLSRGRPQGAGIGPGQADDIFRALSESEAIRTGLLTSLEECELMVDGVSDDKISDLTTNVLRGPLAEYTQGQCDLHGIPTRDVAVGPTFDVERLEWVNDYIRLPVATGGPVLLVPKAIARTRSAYDSQRFYGSYAIEFLRAQQLAAAGNLVRTLKNGTRRVFKKDLEARHPCSKTFLFEFAREHPDILEAYRADLAALEARGPRGAVTTEDETLIAGALRAALQSISPGGDAATRYHLLMIGALELIFFPNLIGPRKEPEIHEGRKRIDIVMENAAAAGIFHRLHTVRHLPCSYIPFECKNYSNEVANPELDQLAGRFGVNRGQVGFLLCRRFEDRPRFVQRCRDTFRDARGLIIGLDDSLVTRLLQHIEQENRPQVDIEIGQLVDEVWLP